MKNRRMTALLTAAALCISLAACSSSDSSDTDTAQEETAEETEEAEEAEEEEAEEAAEEDTAEDAEVVEEAAEEAGEETEISEDGDAVLLSDVTDEDVIGNTYTYDEANAYGFTTNWTLTFESDGGDHV